MASSRLRRAFRLSVAALCASFALSGAAAYWHSLPNLLGFSGQDVYREKDFWCAMAAGVLALGSGTLAIHAARSATKATLGGVIGGIIGWGGLTAVLLALWFSYVLYYALWLAPTQAFALIGVAWCFRLLDRERTARRLGSKMGGL